MELSNVNALITGGSSGIGKATAKSIIDAGGQAVIAARSKDTLEEVASEIGATALPCDVTSESEVISLVDQTIQELDDYNVLINNAGYGEFSRLVNLSATDFERQLKTNTIGAMMVARESAKHFIKNDYGNIINVSSTAGKKGFEGGTAYVASKFALGGMTECWRSELRPHNIRVMQINPSEVQTKFSKNAGQGSRPFNETKLVAGDIAETICSMLSLPDRGFIPETSVWATNPR
ncbi:SDR family oxidoreductase [Fodinibius salsisoli]|uniref:SDR family NAD(P)-dependent oxidoreductase n=1 Tax=Fodinibius salsisoli TaxID=2820877 RepID=A0ABT3PN69_9BACT|nr:SDR family NAD(P)-dependent oxidoreductase [Fodinibius salsisoli]MCW9707400.1 SDR family NAD(P)-dependent oxidoreductase [Fodinibius salsisoli]